MRAFSGDSNTVHELDVAAELRAYFSAAAARLNEDVWLRVEARWIGNGAPVKATLYREDDQGDRETVKEIDGTITAGEWEQRWRVELPRSRLDELSGPIHLVFEAMVEGHPLPVRSQTLLIHRTRFSS